MIHTASITGLNNISTDEPITTRDEVSTSDDVQPANELEVEQSNDKTSNEVSHKYNELTESQNDDGDIAFSQANGSIDYSNCSNSENNEQLTNIPQNDEYQPVNDQVPSQENQSDATVDDSMIVQDFNGINHEPMPSSSEISNEQSGTTNIESESGIIKQEKSKAFPDIAEAQEHFNQDCLPENSNDIRAEDNDVAAE